MPTTPQKPRWTPAEDALLHAARKAGTPLREVLPLLENTRSLDAAYCRLHFLRDAQRAARAARERRQRAPSAIRHLYAWSQLRTT